MDFVPDAGRRERSVRGDVERLQGVRVATSNVHHVEVEELMLRCCADLHADMHGGEVRSECR